MFRTDFIIFVFAVSFATEVERGERLLLHSDVDIATAIQMLTSQVDQLNSQIGQLNSQVGQLSSENAQLRTDVEQLKASKSKGSVYTRWGRTSCPSNGTDLVYKGYVGGNTYDMSGAVDYLCLSSEPLWGAFDDSAASYSSKIYGTEYQFAGQGYANGGSAFFGQNLHNHDAPCAVCHTSRQATLMIPGRNECYPGWTKEYSGYLAAGLTYATHSATSYVCLDEQSESEPGDFRDDDGKLLYLAEAKCGSLRCPPYVNNRELTCVVCSK